MQSQRRVRQASTTMTAGSKSWPLQIVKGYDHVY
jgi:hypothetical protein